MSRLTGAEAPFVGCPVCVKYVERRGAVIEPAITLYAKRRRIHRRRLAHLFFVGVHDRHLSGRSL